MKTIKIAAAAAAVVLLLTACGKSAESKYDFTMPDSPIEFVSTTVADPKDESLAYAAIQFNGKTYVSYGTLEGELDPAEVGSRLGYYVQDGEKIEKIGVFPLTSDPDQNYLFLMDEELVMNEITFFRNSETVGKDITTPSFIKSKNYSYWN